MNKGAITVFAAAFALLMVAGCGGGGGAASTQNEATSAQAQTSPAQPQTSSTEAQTGSEPSRAEFVARVDAVCKAGKARIESNTTKYIQAHKVNTAEPTKAQNEALASEVLAPDLQRQAGEISRLEAPAGDGAKVKALVSAIEDGVRQLEREPSSVTQGEDPFAEAVKLAKEYGIDGCSS